MPADPSIYGNLLRPAAPPLDYANQYTQQAAAAQNLLASRMQMAQQQDALQRRNSLRDYLATGAQGEDLEKGLLSRGYVDEALKFGKDRRENAKTDADTAASIALAEQRKVETQRHLYTYGVQMLQGAQDPQSALAILQQGVGKGAWSMEQAQASIKALQQAAQAGPEGIADWKRRQLATILAPKELLPNVQTRNTGATTDTLAVDPLTGKATVTGSVKNTASPDAVMSNQLGYARLGEEKRAHDMADARARESNATTQQMGRIPPGYRVAADGQSLEAIPGGPAAMGKALPTKLASDLGEQAGIADNTERFKNTFTDKFGGHTLLGEASNIKGRIMGDDTGQAQWWQDYAMHEATIRNKLFGASLTPGEQAQWQKLTITPRMDPTQIRENLGRRAEIEKRALDRMSAGAVAAGYNKEQVEAVTGRPAASKADTVVKPSGKQRTVTRTGTLNGRKVVQYSDGSTEYAD